jgi:Cof subfamily protein (haloacid dehalogenase superfamily)
MRKIRPSLFKCSAMISDVDGTLVTDDKILTPLAKAAAAELRANGIIFSIVSSRPPRGLRMLISSLGISAPVAGFNGGVIASPDLFVISAHVLPADAVRHAIEMLEARGVQVWIFSGADWLVRRADAPYVELEERTVGFGPVVVDDFAAGLSSTAKIVGVSPDFELLARCERELRTSLADRVSVVRSQPYYVDITHPLANKGVAVAEIAKLLGFPLREIATIGDGANDVAMFEKSGLSIAMGNAAPEVQHRADFVTESNDEDGFAHAIKHIILGGGQAKAASAGSRS